MVFNSLTFIAFFAIVLAIHSLPLAWTIRKINLLVASYLFYSAWNPPFVILLWISTVVDWYAAQGLVKAQRPVARRAWMLLSVVANLGMLGYFKYGGFLLANFTALLASFGVVYHAPAPDIVLPVGISFYTFATMCYTLDVYLRRALPVHNFLDYALFVTFFPHLVAGPIMRPTEVVPQFEQPRRATRQQLFFGLALMTIGLFNKVVLADGFLAPVAEKIYDSDKLPGALDAWMGTPCASRKRCIRSSIATSNTARRERVSPKRARRKESDMKSAFIWIALLCCNGAAVAAELCGGTPMPAGADALDRQIVQTMRASHIPGMSVAVLDHGRVVKLRGYGFADLESCVPATEKTLFGIGSISKQMTAVGILTLVRDGKLSLDDPITKYLPEGKGVWDALRVRHLLTHTSGIPDIYGDDAKFPSMHPDRTASPSTPDLVKWFAKGKLNFAPGADWAYSNTGYVLLSVIAERVSGEPFPAFMHERVFVPLGMSSTRNYSPTQLIPGRATPYHVDDKGVVTHGPFISDVFSHWGDTAFISTASDMSRWVQALGRDKLLPPALWQAMLTPVRLRDGTPYPYGFGVMLSQVGNDRLWKHNGTFKVGYFADLLDFPDRSLSAAVLSNYYGDDEDSFFKLPPMMVGALEPQLVLVGTSAAPPDPQAQLTQSLLKTLSGAGSQESGYAGPFAKYSPYPGMLRQVLLHTPSAKLRYFGCDAIAGTPPDAFGTAVTRECRYDIEGAPQVPGLMLWLTSHDEIAGITFW